VNCKPGDLAVIVFCPRGAEHLLGRMVRLTVRAPDCPPVPWRPEVDARPSWCYEGERLTLRSGTVVEKLNDCCLSPIRDPGDDAIDEMLLRVGMPEGETA
jgi:hypothetical protein